LVALPKKIKMISTLKKIIKSKNIDGYIIPKNDMFFSEYSNPDRLKFLTKFTGSAGISIVTLNKNFLFIDGRYKLQAQNECGKNFKILQIPFETPKSVLSKFKNKLSLGYDPNLFTSKSLVSILGNKHELIPLENLIDKFFIKKKKIKIKNFYSLSHKIVGETSKSKVSKIVKILKKKKIDNIFISAPENVSWLLNIRGYDNPYSPIPNCRIILNKNKKIFFFSNLKKIKKIKKTLDYKNCKFCEFEDFTNILSIVGGKTFIIDENSCSIFNESLIRSKFIIKDKIDPCYYLKSIKNKTEIKNMKEAHIADGVALTKFIYLFKNKKKKLTEITAEKVLDNLRKKNKNYLYPSFNTIAGSGPNSAIIHYRSNKKTNRTINKKDIFLLDSGGQYKYGTTDVTRTLCIQSPSKEIRNIYTRVLQGHIAVAQSNLKIYKTGNQIDKNARKPLKKINLDYPHGTGHGVGYFLNVHEGPQSISKSNKITLKKGMILSNEPGFYKKNKFGIRIENLIYIDEKKGGLFFQNLTYAPIDKDLINFKILNKTEKNYLFRYHLEVYNLLSKYLNYDERKWLAKLI
tara:strand:- start:8515 stop:10236 length:1722 start_codon:yes stop_codon:yes gene_type:complete